MNTTALCVFASTFWGSELGYFDNTKHLIFWLSKTKQLNFRHFNTYSKKIFETVIFFPERSNNGSKKTNIILFSNIKGVFGHYDHSGLFQKIYEGYRKISEDLNEEVRPLPKMSEELSKHFKNSILFGNSKHLKMAYLTANTLKRVGK